MKAALITILFFSLLLSVKAQTTTQKKVTKQPQGITPIFLEIDGIKGESSPDTLPPAPKGNFFIGAGPLLSQTSNNNFSPRMSVSSRTGFTVHAGYAFAFAKSRLLINASYSEGGVNIAVGDINGDGTEDKETAKLGYLSIPVQYQHFIDKRKIFYAGGGAYAALLVPAIQKVRGYNEGFEKQDAGVMVSAGARVTSRINISASYQYGLMDIDASPTNRARNGMAFLMLSYSYGPVITIKPKG
jgi:Outer membrane protein beta-barrel domain